MKQLYIVFEPRRNIGFHNLFRRKAWIDPEASGLYVSFYCVVCAYVVPSQVINVNGEY